MNFFDQLSNRGIKLNPTEERIVNYLLEHYGISKSVFFVKQFVPIRDNSLYILLYHIQLIFSPFWGTYPVQNIRW